MKNRLYYKDSYIKSFESTVLKQGEDQAGRPYVILENTAFYPTGGGQPFDMGFLNDFKVVDVEEVDGEIRHYIELPFQETEKHVVGQIDWERRFDHMQQHAGQHLLSAAFADQLGYQTVSFHLGKDRVTIDLLTEKLEKSELELAQAEANDLVMKNLLIQPKWVESDELSQYPIRKEPKVIENIRLVIIEDVDYNACGGTHPTRTAEVGPIQILGTERIKDKTRVTFVCGYRAIHALSAKHDILQHLSQTFMRPEEALIESVNQLLEDHHSLKGQLEEAKKQLLQHEAHSLLEKSHLLPHGEKLVSQFFIERPIHELQMLAHAIKDEASQAIVLLTMRNGEKLQFIAARGDAIKMNMNQVIKDVLPIIHGRGGGKPDHVQGGGEATMTASALLEHLKQSIAGEGSNT